MELNPFRVLIVDDSALFRRLVEKAFGRIGGVEIAGTAADGKQALALAQRLRPHLITLDMEIPPPSGIEVLRELRTWPDKTAVLVLSAMTRQGGKLTMEALEAGALSFITKPEGPDPEENLQRLSAQLSAVLQEIRAGRRFRRHLQGVEAIPHAAPVVLSSRSAAMPARVAGGKRPKLIAIGVSTGGPQALAEILPTLPPDFSLGVVVVQHMPPLFTEALAQSLARKCRLEVREARDGESLGGGRVFLAPGGKQMKIRRAGERLEVHLTDDAAEHHCKPAVDYLFRSLALQAPGEVVGVILTGMGRDGADGLRMLYRSGCHTIAQDEASSLVYGMPKEALAAGAVREVLPLSMIGPRLVQLARGEA